VEDPDDIIDPDDCPGRPLALQLPRKYDVLQLCSASGPWTRGIGHERGRKPFDRGAETEKRLSGFTHSQAASFRRRPRRCFRASFPSFVLRLLNSGKITLPAPASDATISLSYKPFLPPHASMS
jgi:hypothetical protein